ncbi:ATP-binding protein [Patescibacteria group bacterium]|nr:ATP-binding protein [Patescibacteria group bacterium]MBU1886011.1 ATP-binding protein [Patescibacteria group bacterium]
METKELDLDEIEKIIESGNPSGFLGVIETSYFEFREKPYYPDNEHNTVSREKSRLELLKDFSSVANSGGGYVVIGLKPKLDPSKFNLEFVDEVKGVKQESIKLQSWLDTLSSFLTPSFQSGFLNYGFIGSKENQVFWLKVPDAKDIGCYPFILNKDQWVTEDNSLLHGRLLGVYFRDGAENKHLLSAEKIQESIAYTLSGKKGKLSEQSFSGLEAKIDQILALQNVSPTKTLDLESKKKDILTRFSERLDQDSDFFYLIAVPEKPVSVRDFWLKGENTLYELIKDPPTLRHMGWDLHTAMSEYPEPKGTAWESTNGDRKIVYVDKDGVIAVGGTIQEFLDWGLNRDSTSDVLNINAFALVEFITSYFNFLTAYAKKFVQSSLNYQVYGGFSLRLNKKYRLVFTMGENGKPAFFSQQSNEIDQNEWDFGVCSPIFENSTQPFAANLVSTIYASGFGYVEDSPPYLVKKEKSWVINEEAYTKAS